MPNPRAVGRRKKVPPGISRRQVLTLLRDAAPGFDDSWRKHRESWGGQEPGDFNDAAALAHYLVRCYAAGQTAELPVVFGAIERILREGDDDARELAAFGVLEDIQTLATHEPFGPQAFELWLGPAGQKAWAEIGALWQAGGGSLMGVLRLEAEHRGRRLDQKGARSGTRR
jgi:hypothetical protein